MKANSKETSGLLTRFKDQPVPLWTIAEGYERSGNKEFLQLYISKGSRGEFCSQLYRALDGSYISQTEFDELYEQAKEIIVMLQKLINYLEHSQVKGTKYFNREQANSQPH
jgi:hypothetical protein